MENTFTPPLPVSLPLVRSTDGANPVRPGTWLVNYEPIGSPFIVYDGTMRIENQNNNLVASGDLYQRSVDTPTDVSPNRETTIFLPPPNPAAGIPIQGRDWYRYYMSITKIVQRSGMEKLLELGFQMWKFNSIDHTWANEGGPNGDFNATMTWTTAPGGYPSASDYLEGDVKMEGTGSAIGQLKMGWVSTSFRKATIEIDTVPGSEPPTESGTGETWASIFSTVGWDVTVHISDFNVTEPSGESWSDAEMHATMLKWRDQNNLDTEWRYHILAVKQLDSTPRGIMYDAGATDSDRVPREGIGISSHWIIPQNGRPDWGSVKGQRFGTAKAPYFRTAVHELGHAFGLIHNTIDTGFMNTSDMIAEAGPFPFNIKWSYAENDLKRLRHYPDVYVRPGGVPFGMANRISTPISTMDGANEASKLTLEVKPLLAEVPLGAPVRVTVTLINKGERPIRAPCDINLKYGFLRGIVKYDLGKSRRFDPFLLCIDSYPMCDLKKDETRCTSLTLLRGVDGALFPSSGTAEIVVEASWSAGTKLAEQFALVGKATVLITAPQTANHAVAAHKVLTAPDAHLVLMLGGYHLEEGMSAIGKTLVDETLRPHFAAIEAKRLLQPFLGKRANIEKAAQLTENARVVMSPAEAGKLKKLFRKAEAENQTGARTDEV